MSEYSSGFRAELYIHLIDQLSSPPSIPFATNIEECKRAKPASRSTTLSFSTEKSLARMSRVDRRGDAVSTAQSAGMTAVEDERCPSGVNQVERRAPWTTLVVACRAGQA